MDAIIPEQIYWPLWRRILFRFFFVYFVLNIAPWTWLDVIPGVSYITQFYYQLMDWAVNMANANIFHVRKVLVPMNGSGDTSYGWAQFWLFIWLSFIGCVVWSIVDSNRLNYRALNYGLCLFTRYYVALIAFSYGIIKLFALQMPFPNLSQMATPLGDFLPMRLSWMFIGYSAPYQIFAGGMEVTVGVLLLYRRTTTLGVLLATAVFTNVMMLNLSYDIPVKIFSINIVLMCLYLLANEYNRIVCFFILNKPATVCSTYHFPYTKKWMRVTRVILKISFIIIAVGITFYQSWNWYKTASNPQEIKPVKPGIYDVAVYAKNKDTIPPLITDTLRWQDVIFEKGGTGSIKTSDTLFRHLYNRAYFAYSADTLQHTMSFKKFFGDSSFIMMMHYEIPDTNTIKLWAKERNDSLYVELKRNRRHFQLAEKQFHWLSEYNR
jgi:hypothetical protein